MKKFHESQQQSAAKENTMETVAAIEELISERQKQLEANMQKLGMRQRSRRQRD